MAGDRHQHPRRLFRLAIWRKARADLDVDREIAFHLDQRTARLIDLGYSPEAARAEALRRFGDLERARRSLTAAEHHLERHLRMREHLEELVADLRHAVGRLSRQPLAALFTILTIAIGIGVNATVFSWMETLVLDPLPAVHDARSLMALSLSSPHGASQSISYPDYLDWRSMSKTIRDIVLVRDERLSIKRTSDGDAEPAWGALVSANYFSVLGVRPILGRTFLPNESAPLAHAGSAPVVLLSYRLWQDRFSGDSGALGRPIWVNGLPMTIIGVLPQGFRGAETGFSMDLWAPVTMQPALVGQPLDKLTWRATRWMHAIARLAPFVSLSGARAELATIGSAISATHPEDRDLAPTLAPLFDVQAPGIMRPVLLALLGGTGLVLLIVCANVGSLRLLAGMTQEREIAVRLALGSGRFRLVRQFVVEAALLTVVGSAAALIVARWAAASIGRVLSSNDLPVAIVPRFDGRVFALALALAVLVTLLVGIWPALRASRVGASTALHGAGERGTSYHTRARRVLVVAQLALSLVALTMAGLFVRSLRQLQKVDSGLRDAGHVLVVSSNFDLAGSTYRGFENTKRLAIVHSLLGRARALPGVEGAAASQTAPLGLITGFDSFDTEVVGHVKRPGEPTSFEINFVTAGYFHLVGPALAAGREFADADRAGAPYVVVVNEAFARRFWPGPDAARQALGKELRLASHTATVIGVVHDGKLHDMSESPFPFYYLPFDQWSPTSVALDVRTQRDPLSLAPAVRQIVHEVEPSLPVLDVHPLSDQIDGALAIQRLSATLLGVLGAIALVLATLGLYGTLAQAVLQRRREIGIRIALGARRQTVLLLFAREGLVLAIAALVLGLPAAFGAARVMRGQIYGIGVADPWAIGGTIVLLLGVSLGASLVTATRATRVDPAVTLREQ